MSFPLSIAIFASDVFEHLLTNTSYGNEIKDKIFENKLGDVRYVTNLTVVSVLQKLNYEPKITERAMRIIHPIPQIEYKDQNRAPFLIEEPVRGTAWGDAIFWFTKYTLPKEGKNSLIDLSLVSWAELAMLKWIFESEKRPRFTYLVTKNENFKIVKKMNSSLDLFPYFEVLQ